MDPVFDQKKLSEFGIEFKDDKEAEMFSDLIEEEFLSRLGKSITRQCSREQIKEYDATLGTPASREWLERNIPNFRDIYKQTVSEMEKELITNKTVIINSKSDKRNNSSLQLEIPSDSCQFQENPNEESVLFYCPKCGNQFTSYQFICEKCGLDLKEDSLIYIGIPAKNGLDNIEKYILESNSYSINDIEADIPKENKSWIETASREELTNRRNELLERLNKLGVRVTPDSNEDKKKTIYRSKASKCADLEESKKPGDQNIEKTPSNVNKFILSPELQKNIDQLNNKFVKNVENLIDKVFGNKELSISSIDVARHAYDNLADDQKRLVSNYDTFEAIEKIYMKLHREVKSILIIRPTVVEEARGIVECLLENYAILLNLEGLDLDIAQRIIDFSSGSTFTMNGTLSKISSNIFILAPKYEDLLE